MNIMFTAEGITLEGDLAIAGPGAPAVVLTGPFTGVKEQVTGLYARKLHERGITTLTFDHRGFGASGGRRGHEDTQGKLADLRAAVTLLTTHPAIGTAPIDLARADLTGADLTGADAGPTGIGATPSDPAHVRGAPIDPARIRAAPIDPAQVRAAPIDPAQARAAPIDPVRNRRASMDVVRGRAVRIGAVGICLGGGYAMRAAAADPRIRAVAGIAGAYNSPARFAAADPAAYRRALASFIDRYDDDLPAVAPHGGEAAMGGDEPWDYYGTSRSAAKTWRNRVTYGSLHSLMTFDALAAAPLLTETPSLLVHGRTDDYCSPDLAQAFHAAAAGPKQFHWVDAKRHIDLYDVEPYVSEAADVTAAFLHKTLGSTASNT
jgi:fermentation-respiration switch protein FrsA (DUF1100 family)